MRKKLHEMHKQILLSFIVGLLFALGLGISGMTNASLVIGFLDFFSHWKPELMGVMGGAIFVHSISYYFIKKRRSPFFAEQFQLPTKKDIDTRLILGAIMFGIGWGLVGICPGPGLVSLFSGHYEVFIFVSSMLVGMKIFKKWGPK